MNNTLKAGLWMSGAILSFSAMAVAGRSISFELDTFEIMFFRSLIGIFVVVSVALMAGTLPQIRTRQIRTHFIRNIGHFAGQNLWFYAITVIPLAQVFALEFTSPLWAMLLAAVVLGEKLTRYRVAAALVGFIGILIIARPGVSAISIGQIAAALSAVGFAISAIFTRKLTREDSITCILFYLTVLQACFGLICAGIDGDIALPSSSSVPWLVLIGCAGLVAHFCLTTALSLAPATLVIPIDFLRLPLIALVGWLIYNETLDYFVLIGAVLIFGANYLNILKETRHNR